MVSFVRRGLAEGACAETRPARRRKPGGKVSRSQGLHPPGDFFSHVVWLVANCCFCVFVRNSDLIVSLPFAHTLSFSGYLRPTQFLSGTGGEEGSESEVLKRRSARRVCIKEGRRSWKVAN